MHIHDFDVHFLLGSTEEQICDWLSLGDQSYISTPRVGVALHHLIPLDHLLRSFPWPQLKLTAVTKTRKQENCRDLFILTNITKNCFLLPAIIS